MNDAKYLMGCRHYACHLLTVHYSCNLHCGATHSTVWCEMCEAEGKDVKPADLSSIISERHLNLRRKPKGYDRKAALEPLYRAKRIASGWSR